MPDAKTSLLVLLGVVGALFSAFWGWSLARSRERVAPGPYELFVGFVTDFYACPPCFVELHFAEGIMAGVFPTHGGEANVWACTPAGTTAEAGGW